MRGHVDNKRIPKPPKVTYEVLLTITDDGKDGNGGVAYLTYKQIRDMLNRSAAQRYAGVKIRVNAIQELPGDTGRGEVYPNGKEV